tara:strand:+ start:5431 stop:6027 length:597 start_codon:yes stop_codon:yes gene_type:complete
MIRNLFFMFFVFFFVISPAKAEPFEEFDFKLPWQQPVAPPENVVPEEKVVNEEQIKSLIVLIESSLQCQVAAELTRNYYYIYLGFKQGLEKTDPDVITKQAVNPPPTIKALEKVYKDYQDIIVFIKAVFKATDPSVDIDAVEKKRSIELRQQFSSKVVYDMVDHTYINSAMTINSECWSKLEVRQKQVKEIFNLPKLP